MKKEFIFLLVCGVVLATMVTAQILTTNFQVETTPTIRTFVTEEFGNITLGGANCYEVDGYCESSIYGKLNSTEPLREVGDIKFGYFDGNTTLMRLSAIESLKEWAEYRYNTKYKIDRRVITDTTEGGDVTFSSGR